MASANNANSDDTNKCLANDIDNSDSDINCIEFKASSDSNYDKDTSDKSDTLIEALVTQSAI